MISSLSFDKEKMSRYYGYVYNLEHLNNIFSKGIDRSFRVDETISFAIQYNGWNPKDVWVLTVNMESLTIFLKRESSNIRRIHRNEEIAEKWNHSYIHGFGGISPEYSAISMRLQSLWWRTRAYCMCVDDYKSKWYVEVCFIPRTEVRTYWQNSGMGYEAARFAFFDESVHITKSRISISIQSYSQCI